MTNIIKPIIILALFTSSLFGTLSVSSQINSIEGISTSSSNLKLRYSSLGNAQALSGSNLEVYGTFIVQNLNKAPLVTSNGGEKIANISIAENTTHVSTITVSDEENNTPFSFSLSSGLDSSKFEINTATGILKFKEAPNFEIPNDLDSNNIYVVEIKVKDLKGSVGKQLINVSVTDANDAPSISGSSVLSTNEDSLYSFTPVAVDADRDVLEFSITNKPTWASFDTSTGRLSGIPTNDDIGTTTGIVISVKDPSNEIASLTAFNLSVLNTNDAPTISGSPNTSVLEDSAYSFTPSANDIDPLDNISFEIQNKPSWASFDTSTGKLSGIPTNDDVGNHENIIISVKDSSNTKTSLNAFSIEVINTNDAPSASNITINTNEDTLYSFTLNDFNYVDVDGDVLNNIQILSLPLKGQLKNDGNPVNINETISTTDLKNLKFTFMPALDENANSYASFNFRVSDGQVYSGTYTVTINVNAINDKPIIVSTLSNESKTENFGSFTKDIEVNDVEKDTLNLEVSSSSELITLDTSAWTNPLSSSAYENTNQTLTINSVPRKYGKAEVLVKVKDLANLSSSKNFFIDVPATLSFPDISDEEISLNEDFGTFDITLENIDLGGQSSGTITLVPDDTSIYNAPASVNIEASDNGRKVITLSSKANTFGDTTATISLDNGHDAIVSKTISIKVKAVNDAPTISGVPNTGASENIAYSFTPTVTDAENDSLSFSILNKPPWASFDISTGKLSGTPRNADVGKTSNIVISVSDRKLISSLASFDLVVTNVNDAPTISGTPNTSIQQDSAYSFTPSANDVDLGDVLSFEIQNKPSWANFDTNTGRLSGTPKNSDVGLNSNIIISVSDSILRVSLPSFNLEVININDAPTINGTANTSVQQNSTYSFIPSANDVDIGDSISFEIENKPSWASFDTSTGKLSGTPNNSHVGITRNIIISVKDRADTKVALDSFDLEVININDAPTISGTPNTSVNEDSFYSFTPNANDVDVGDSISFEIQNKPVWASFDPVSGKLSGTPNNSHVGTTNNIIISVKDNSNIKTSLTSFNLEVVNTNDAPTISGDPATIVNEDSTYSFTPSANDVDVGDSISFEIQNKPSWASFDTSTGKLSGTPENDDVGVTTAIVISVKDSNDTKTSLSAFNLEVKNTNDAPIISGSPATSINEDSAYSFTPNASDVDVGDSISFEIENKPSWASFNSSTGKLSGTPINTDVGITSGIVISVKDSSNTKVSLASFNLEVVNTNDAPTISGTPDISVVENLAYSFTPSASDVDVGDSISFEIQNKPSWASFNSSTGKLSGTPNSSHIGITNNIIISVKDSSNVKTALNSFNLEVLRDTDGDGIADINDDDSDNDGISDIDEGGEEEPPRDTDRDGTADYLDTDSDNDGILDINEGVGDYDKDGIPDYLDALNAPSINNAASESIISLSVLENQTTIVTISASHDSPSLAYKIISGDDKDLFNLDENSGELSFKTIKDYENPSDANSDNIYSVQIEAYYKALASSSSLKDTQTINVQVLNAHELLTINSTAKTNTKENEAYTYAITASSDDNKTQIEYEGLNLPSWLSLENTNNYTSKKIVSPNFSINHSNDITDYLVEISTNYLAYRDKLSLDESLASSYAITSSYDNAKGILKLSGTTSADNWEKILRTVEITLHKDQSATRSVNFSEGLRGDILSLEKDGVIHYYELVKEKITWDEAKTKAEQKTFQGKQGYLVTITSEEENELLNTKVNSDMWIGASDSDSESIWKWVTGPEKGQHFFTQTKGFKTSPHLSSVYNNKKSGGGVAVNNKYNNWAKKEPNDWGGTGEPNAHIRANGQWNDYPAHFKAYYIVEYGGMSEDSNTNITQVVKVTKEKTYILKGTPKVAGRYDVSIKASQNKLSDTQNFTIEVENKNDAPVLNTANFVIKEDTNINFVVGSISAIDEDNISPSIDLIGKLQNITYSIESGNTNNTFSLDASTGELKLNKALNAYENSRYILEIKAQDEEGASSKKQFVVKVTNLDDKPVSNNDVVSLNEDTSLDIEVLANDSDRDNNIDVESVKIKTQTNNGKLEVQASGKVKYTPNKNFNGNDSFTYEVYDTTKLKSNEAKVDITVNSVNDAPLTFNKVLRTNEDIYLIEDLENLAFDADGDDLNFETQEVPTHGNVSYSDGVLEYIPNANYYGSDSFTFNVKDSSNNTSNTSRIYVNIAEVNDIPVALDDEVSLDEDTNITIDVLVNDVDDEGLDSTSISILKQPTNGLVNIQAGKIIYTPNANFSGEDSFEYTVKDTGLKTGTQSSSGVLISNAAKVNITVNAVNDAPQALDDNYTIVQNSLKDLNVKINDSDIDTKLKENTILIVSQSTYGKVSVEDGFLRYIPNKDYIGDDSFTYKINDGQDDSNIATVNLSILNDADNDGIADINDTDKDNDGIEDSKDNDDDNDGISDIDEGINETPIRDTDNDGIPDYLDKDSDNDGVKDVVEGKEASKDPSIKGDIDSDGDGIPNSQEGAGEIPFKDSDKDGIPDFKDGDSDNDGILDIQEGNKDTDKDGIPDYLDSDSDNNGIPDANEAIDTDNDGVLDAVDLDDDNDGIPDSVEGNADIDKDGVPNSKDSDSDGDGKSDKLEGVLDSDLDGIKNYLDANDNGSDSPIDNGDGTQTSTFKKVKGSGEDKVTKLVTNTGKPLSQNENQDGSTSINISEPNSTIDINNDGSINININESKGNHDINITNPGSDIKIVDPDNDIEISTPVYINPDGSTCQYDLVIKTDGSDILTRHYLNKGKASQILTTVIMKMPNASIKINEKNEVIHTAQVLNESLINTKVTGIVSCDGAIKTITKLENQETSFVAVNEAGSTVIIQTNGDVDTTTKLEDSQSVDNALEGLNFKVDSNTGEITASKVFKDKTTNQVTYTQSEIYILGTKLNVNGNKIRSVDVDISNKRKVQVDVKDTQNNTLSSITQIDNTIEESAISKISNGEDGQISTQVQMSEAKVIVNNKLDGKIEHKVEVGGKVSEASSNIEGANTTVTNKKVSTVYDDKESSGVIAQVDTNMEGKTEHILKLNSIVTQAISELIGTLTQIAKDLTNKPKISTTVQTLNTNNQNVEIQVDANADGSFSHELDINSVKTKASSKIAGANTLIKADGQIETSSNLDETTSSKVVATPQGFAIHEVKTSEFTTRATFNIIGANTLIETTKQTQTTLSLKETMCQDKSEYVIVDVNTNVNGESETMYKKYSCNDDSFIEDIKTLENQVFKADNKIEVSLNNTVVEISTQTKLDENIQF